MELAYNRIQCWGLNMNGVETSGRVPRQLDFLQVFACNTLLKQNAD